MVDRDGLLEALQVVRCRFALRCTSRMELDSFIGAQLRSDFGNGLRNSGCKQQQENGAICEDCTDFQCPYHQVFAPTDGAFNRITPPFLFEPLFPQRTEYWPGQEMCFNLVLIGKAIARLEDFISVFEQLGRRGIGRDYMEGQGRFHLARVTADAAASGQALLYDGASARSLTSPPIVTGVHFMEQAQRLESNQAIRALTVHFVSATEIRHKHDGRKNREPLRSFEFHHLWDSVTGRLEELMKHHCGAELRTDFKELKALAIAVAKVDESLSWANPEPPFTDSARGVLGKRLCRSHDVRGRLYAVSADSLGRAVGPCRQRLQPGKWPLSAQFPVRSRNIHLARE
jgi:hypothetical protein